MFNTVNQFCQNYYDQLPTDGLRAIGLSTILSFTASVTIITLTTPTNQMPNSLSRAGCVALISCLATSIHVVTHPIFNYVFDNPNDEFNGYQEFISTCIDITLSHILINYATSYKVNLLTSMSISKENFIILPSSIVKITLDMLFRGLDYIYPGIRDEAYNDLKNEFNIDLKYSSTPVYLVI